MQIHIPGEREIRIHHLVLDFNGTIALDGKLQQGVRERLVKLEKLFTIHVLTADSNGSAARECAGLPVILQIISQDDQREKKRSYVCNLSPKGVAVMGNGVNDELMFRQADLAIAIVGKEGCATVTLMASHIVVNNIADGLDLLLQHHRLVPTLRK
ncbi:HAD family hydrolase [Paenibacillus sp. UNC496MF]|uniref:HAD family hydrolase n=1 Tax=Paenibacillus sp. UNC496MF TaxID=1502753 RepID=UPI0011605749|nr:HAD family hydrolase [Paenibacillus sp. UNC496MF]